MAPLACWGQANPCQPSKQTQQAHEQQAAPRGNRAQRCWQDWDMVEMSASHTRNPLAYDASGCLCPPCGAESQSVLSWAIQAVFGCSQGRYVVITCQQPLSGFSLQSANNNIHSSSRLFWRSVEKELLAGDPCVARAAIQGSPVSSPCLASFTYRTPKQPRSLI